MNQINSATTFIKETTDNRELAINIVKALIFNEYIYDEVKKHLILAENDKDRYLSKYAVTQ